MKNIITEEELLRNGFTPKNIARLNDVLSREENKNENYESLLIDLRKRFFGGCFLILMLFVFIAPAAFNEDTAKGVSI